MKTSILFFWLLLPILSYDIVNNFKLSIFLSILAGFSTFLSNLISYKVLKFTNQTRRLYFGIASLFCSVSLIGLTHATNYLWIMIFTFLGGISIGSLSSCQDSSLYDVLGIEMIRSIYKGFSTIVGLCILGFCFIHNTIFCLSLIALLQFLGGLYWISSPTLNLIKATRYRSHKIRVNEDEI